MRRKLGDTRIMAVTVFMAVAAACTRGKPAPGAGDSTAAGSSGAQADSPPSMAGMQGAGDLPGMQGMMTQMQAHLHMLESADGDSIKAVLPTHRQMTANLLAAMNREMSSMNMKGDAAWTAIVDSVRQDLVNLADQGAAELEDVMPAHRRRIARLMEAHQAMMKDMKM